MNTPQNPIVVVNVFTPKPGMLDEFIAVQTAALPGLTRKLRGLRGSRLYRAQDGSRAVLISVFESADVFELLTQSQDFAEHRARIAPFIERADPARYTLAYEAGTL